MTGFGKQGREVVVGESLAPFGPQRLLGTVGDEHAEPAPFDQDLAVHQQVDALGGRGGIDPVEGGQFVGGGGTLSLSKGAVKHRCFDLFSNLHEQRASVLHGLASFHQRCFHQSIPSSLPQWFIS